MQFIESWPTCIEVLFLNYLADPENFLHKYHAFLQMYSQSLPSMVFGTAVGNW
jgi:hypothetical protein